MKTVNPESPNFLNKKDPHFKHLCNTLGIGNKVKQGEVITNEEEDKL